MKTSTCISQANSDMTTRVLLHPALAGPVALRGLDRALGGGSVMPGLPGHPGGGTWDRASAYMDQAVAQALAALPAGPVHLFGHSLGGAVALRVAVEHPDLVTRLDLFEPVMFAAASAEARADHAAEMAPFMAAFETGNHARAAEVFAGLWSGGVPWPALPELVRKQMTALIDVIPATRPALMDDIHRVLPRLADCGVPTWIWTSATPAPIAASIQEGLVARLPQAQGGQIDHASGHMIPVMAPDVMATAMRA